MNCPFCSELSTPKNSSYYIAIGQYAGLDSRVLLETENWYAVPTLGCLTVGYVLLVCSRCRPGLPPGGPRAPPHSASRKPEDRRGRGWRGCSLSGAPLAGLRHFWAGPRPQPPPQPQPPARPQPHPSTHPRRQPLGLPQARAHNTHTHTHTKQSRTHTHTTPPPPRKVKSRRPQVRETEKEGERETDSKRTTQTSKPPAATPCPLHSGFPPAPSRPDPTVAHRHTHTHTLPHSPSGLGAGAGSRRRWPSRRGPLRPRMRGSPGVPTGDCQPQGTASSRGPPAQG